MLVPMVPNFIPKLVHGTFKNESGACDLPPEGSFFHLFLKLSHPAVDHGFIGPAMDP